MALRSRETPHIHPNMKLKMLMAAVPLVMLVSCGGVNSVNPPMAKVSKPLRLDVKKFDKGDMQLVVGARRIEGTEFVVQPKGAANPIPVMLLGPLAVFAEDAIMEKKLDNEGGHLATLQRIDLSKLSADVARERTVGKAPVALNQGSDVLIAESHCEFVQQSKGVWSVGVSTDMSIRSSSGKLIWRNGIGKTASGAQPIEGWLKNDGAPLKAALKSSLAQTWDELNSRIQAGGSAH